VFDAVKEIIEISKASGVSAEISHIKSQPPEFLGHIPGILGLIEGARRAGIRKMTSYPAQRLGLRDRGRIALGLWADLTLFSLKHIKNEATYINKIGTLGA